MSRTTHGFHFNLRTTLGIHYNFKNDPWNSRSACSKHGAGRFGIALASVEHDAWEVVAFQLDAAGWSGVSEGGRSRGVVCVAAVQRSLSKRRAVV